MKLIVGLGNPGNQYNDTRHNVGFMYLDRVAEFNHITFTKKFNAEYADYNQNGEKIILLKPNTFMNNSGEAVRKFKNFFNLDNDDILIVFDDLDLDFGITRFKKDSSHGGHNGIKSIISHLGTQKFARVKIGICNEYKKDTKEFVLSKFSKVEIKELPFIYSDVTNLIDNNFNK